MTADELLRLPDDGWRYELIDGELHKMAPRGCSMPMTPCKASPSCPASPAVSATCSRRSSG
jgi:hypothetical protein